MPVLPEKQAEWDKCVKINSDAYGKACVDVARKVMELLDAGEPFDPHELIAQADDAVKTGGITVFMAGCVASMVSSFHSRGNEFKTAWNRHYGVESEDHGVVNPAVVVLKTEPQ